jgi:hypothetical protein
VEKSDSGGRNEPNSLMRVKHGVVHTSRYSCEAYEAMMGKQYSTVAAKKGR